MPCKLQRVTYAERVGHARLSERSVGRTKLSSSKIQAVARITLDQLLEIPTAERVELAQTIWESVAQNPENVPLTQPQREELDRRLEAFERNPNTGSTWEFLKRSLRGE